MADVLAVEARQLGDVVPFAVEVEPGDGAPHAAQPRKVLMAASATSSTTTPTIRMSPGTFGWEGRGRGGGRSSVTGPTVPAPRMRTFASSVAGERDRRWWRVPSETTPGRAP